MWESEWNGGQKYCNAKCTVLSEGLNEFDGEE